MSVLSFKPTDIQIQITEPAIKHLEKWLKNQASGNAICVGTKKTGCSGFAYDIQAVDAAQPGELISIGTFENLSVFIDPKSVAMLNGLEIDFQQADLGLKKLTFKNPNETARCGCGESFSVDKR